MNILFMDDDEEARLLGSTQLRERGHTAFIVSNENAAIDALLNHNITGAILDVMGNDIDTGLKAARRLTAIDPTVKCVLVSGGFKPSGADEFFFAQKPYDIDKVIAMIDAKVIEIADRRSSGEAHLIKITDHRKADESV